MAITRSSKKRPFVASASRNVRNRDLHVFGGGTRSPPNELPDIQGIPNSSDGSDQLPSRRKRGQTSMAIIGEQRDSPTEADVYGSDQPVGTPTEDEADGSYQPLATPTGVNVNGSGQPVTIVVSLHDRNEGLYESGGGLNSPPNNPANTQGSINSSNGNDQQPKKRKRGRPRKEVFSNGQASPSEVELNSLVQKIVAATPQHESHGDLFGSGEPSYSPSILSAAIYETPVSSNGNDERLKRGKRGQAKMKFIGRAMGSSADVEFNGLGQPVGENAAPLCSFLGCLVRKKVPVTFERWTQLSSECKDDLWNCVQQNYLIHDRYKKEILKRMGKCWRGYKAGITRKIKQISQSDDASCQFALLMPDNIKSSEEWEAFVKQRTSAEFTAKSEKYRRMRVNQTMIHTLGRRGYACLLHEMKKKSPTPSKISRVDAWTRGHLRKDGKPVNEAAAETIRKLEEYSKSPEAQTATSLREDAIAKLFGPESRGQIRGLGFGATASKVDVEVVGGSKMNKLEDEVKALRQQVIDLKTMLLQETRQQCLQGQNARDEDTMHVSGPTQEWDVRDGEMMRPSEATQGRNVRDEMLHPIEATPQGQNVSDEGMMHSSGAIPQLEHGRNDSFESADCKLVHWMEGTEVIAKVEIVSKDPHKLVHHVKLGADCWEIRVNQVTVDNVPLYRPTPKMFCLEDAVGSTIAWPCKYINME